MANFGARLFFNFSFALSECVWVPKLKVLLLSALESWLSSLPLVDDRCNGPTRKQMSGAKGQDGQAGLINSI